MFERLRFGYQRISSRGNGEGKKKGITGLKWILNGISGKVRAALVAALVVLFVLAVAASSGSPVEQILEPPVRLVTPVGAQAQYLHLLLPANRKSPNLCKTLTSARALNYPIPSLLNWDEPFDNSAMKDGGAHLAMIKASLNYLEMFHGERDSDVVMIPKSYDTWFQLRPDVVMERYFEINRQADERTRRRLGKTAVSGEQIAQKIIFAAKKRCLPAEADDLPCYAVPRSPLPIHIYGPETDNTAAKEELAFLNFRERFLDNSLIIGELGAMRKMLERALEYLQANSEVGTDQSTFARIFGEQEYQREVIRERYMGTARKAAINFIKFFGLAPPTILDYHSTHRKMEPADGHPFEFGIGLDYESLIGHSTVDSANELEWLRYNDTANAENVRKAKKASSAQPMSSAPDDVLRSVSPYWTRNGAKEYGLPEDQNWNSVPLYSNIWTHSVPASFHYHDDAFSKHPIPLRTDGWKEMWFHGHLRQLMTNFVNEPWKAFAVIKEDGKEEMAWWPLHQEKWATRIHGFEDREWIAWRDLCGDWDEVLFGDGKGAWNVPRTDY